MTKKKQKIGETMTEQGNEGPKPKKQHNKKRPKQCACKTGCTTRECGCLKNLKNCIDDCKCVSMQCGNRSDG